MEILAFRKWKWNQWEMEISTTSIEQNKPCVNTWQFAFVKSESNLRTSNGRFHTSFLLGSKFLHETAERRNARTGTLKKMRKMKQEMISEEMS